MEGLELFAADRRQVRPVRLVDRFGRAASRDQWHSRFCLRCSRIRASLGRSKGHAMKPMPKELRPVDRAGPSGQDQEGGLEASSAMCRSPRICRQTRNTIGPWR